VVFTAPNSRDAGPRHCSARTPMVPHGD
jgi:hypothetical protein